MSIHDQYLYLKSRPSEINEHLEDLYNLGKKCEHITEFGCGHGVSLRAFMASKPKKIVSYDYRPQETVYAAIGDASNDHECQKTQFQYIIQDIMTVTDIEETDLLFVDSLHTYSQVKHELKFGNKARKFIAFHDTVLFGRDGERGEEGIMRAIEEFLVENSHWKVIMNKENCCGLMVLQII